MPKNLEKYTPASGRMILEDGSVINVANLSKSQHDRLTGGKKVINTDHYYIHRGRAFKSHIFLASVGDTPINYSFKTPEDLYLHFKNLKIQALGGTCRVSVRRGTASNPLSLSSAGSVDSSIRDPVNLNDNSIRVSGVTILRNPVISGGQDGEEWFFGLVLGDSTNQFTSVDSTQISDNEEYVMKNDTSYLIRFEKIGGDSPSQVNMTMFWYEEDEGQLIE